MYKKHNDDFFTTLIKGADSKLQAQLNYMYSRNRMMEEYRRKKEMEQMKKEITEDVIASVNIRIEDEALKQLRDVLNDLGK